MSDLLDTVEFETGTTPESAVIWMHGLGADGHDFAPIVPELGLPPSLSVRFVFPQAPMRPVTINQGWVMRAWYDVRDDGGERREDEAGVRESQRAITTLIERERTRGVPDRHVVLAGFSQGGAMALHTGLRYAERLAGILALSCFLPLADKVAAERSDANRETSIFMAHGIHDPLIPLARARQAHDTLTALGHPVEWHDYPIPHSVNDQEVLDIAAWLGRVLAG